MYSADFDFDCKSHFGGFCGWSAVLKSESFDGGKIANAMLVVLISTVLTLSVVVKPVKMMKIMADLTAQPATSTSINDIKIRAMNFLSPSDKTISVLMAILQ